MLRTPEIPPADNNERRRFLPPDSEVTGKSVVVSESTSIPFEPLVPLVPAPPPSARAGKETHCIAELLGGCKGRVVKLTVDIGGKVSEASGHLVFASHGHIAIMEERGRNLTVFDLSVVREIKVYDMF